MSSYTKSNTNQTIDPLAIAAADNTNHPTVDGAGFFPDHQVTVAISAAIEYSENVVR